MMMVQWRYIKLFLDLGFECTFRKLSSTTENCAK